MRINQSLCMMGKQCIEWANDSVAWRARRLLCNRNVYYSSSVFIVWRTFLNKDLVRTQPYVLHSCSQRRTRLNGKSAFSPPAFPSSVPHAIALRLSLSLHNFTLQSLFLSDHSHGRFIKTFISFQERFQISQWLCQTVLHQSHLPTDPFLATGWLPGQRRVRASLPCVSKILCTFPAWFNHWCY